jgi:inhibitor of KinA
MSCVYPLETPAGWHLIGRSPVPFLQRYPRPAALLSPGDTVSFTPVSLREYEDLLAKAAAGALEIKPTNAKLEAA